MAFLKKRVRRLEVRLQRNARVQAALQGLYRRYIAFVYRTTRWERIGMESYEADISRGVPRVLCLWHGRLAMMPFLRDWSDHGLTVLASRHADARIASAAVRRLGIDVIELGTSEVNSGAIKKAVAALRAGRSLGVTVDGPLGPRGVVKPGALVLAGLAGVQVSPCSYAVTRRIVFRTWDGFVLPLPWSRGVMALGDGFVPPRRASEHELRAAAEDLARRIDALTELCERRLAESSVKPRAAG